MTTRNLDALFKPRSIALVGASARPGSVGNILSRNLLGGGFSGQIMLVNPHEDTILSRPCVRDVGALPETPDLAILATPAATVPDLISRLGGQGCRAAVVISAGFGEGGVEAGAVLRQRLLDAARPHLLRIVGPNCLGFLSPARGINASFAHIQPGQGGVALVSQSGAATTALLDWAAGDSIGFSHLVSVGDMCDVDLGDLLDYLALDAATRMILLYVETVTQARKFMSAARIAARLKPVIVIKGGRSDAGARAALSHTGALAGSDAVYDAAFRRAGLFRAQTLRELTNLAAAVGWTGAPTEPRLSILTNGGGLGVLAVDALERRGGQVAELTDEVRGALDACLPAAWSHGDPVDILGDADGARYGRALRILGQAGGPVLVLNCPTGVSDAADIAETIAAQHGPASPPILAAWVGEETAAKGRRRLRAAGVPAYDTPEEAVDVFVGLTSLHRARLRLAEAPSIEPISEDVRGRAQALIGAAQVEGRSVLTEPESKALLALFGIPVVETFVARDATAAAAKAAEIPGAVALKILSRDITHKSDVGGVRLDLFGSDGVRTAAKEMLRDVAAKVPEARIDGFTVQPMVHRPHAQELLLGLAVDATFGPIIMFGEGGVAVGARADRAIALPPLNHALAAELIDRTRVARLLAGYRDVPAANRAAICDALISLSELVVQTPGIAELDINPLLADETGVIALDARVIIRTAVDDKTNHLAIAPYPRELCSETALRDGRSVALRVALPADASAVETMLAACAPDVRMSQFDSVGGDFHVLSARLCQIDYDRELTFLALQRDGSIAAFAHLCSDPDGIGGEFDLMVRGDVRRLGLGRALLERTMTVAQRRGMAALRGDVLVDNGAMIDLGRRLGATVKGPDEGGTMRLSFDLTSPPRSPA